MTRPLFGQRNYLFFAFFRSSLQSSIFVSVVRSAVWYNKLTQHNSDWSVCLFVCIFWRQYFFTCFFYYFCFTAFSFLLLTILNSLFVSKIIKTFHLYCRLYATCVNLECDAYLRIFFLCKSVLTNFKIDSNVHCLTRDIIFLIEKKFFLSARVWMCEKNCVFPFFACLI